FLQPDGQVGLHEGAAAHPAGLHRQYHLLQLQEAAQRAPAPRHPGAHFLPDGHPQVPAHPVQQPGSAGLRMGAQAQQRRALQRPQRAGLHAGWPGGGCGRCAPLSRWSTRLMTQELLVERIPEWNKAYRLINSCFPPISVFEDTLDPEDLEIAYAIESMTNDRLRDQAGEISRVAPEDRVSGAGATVVMAVFT